MNAPRTLTLSHSSLREWQVCPKLYELTYLRRLEMRGGCGTAAAVGTAFHSALAAWHRHGRAALAKAALRSSWPAEADQPLGWGLDVLAAYIAKHSPDPDVANVVFAEKSFLVPIGYVGDTLVQFAGTLDLVCIDRNAQFFLLDHKTTSLSHGLWLSDQRVSDQWPAYRLGTEALLGRDCPRVLLNKLSTRKTDPEPFIRCELPIAQVTVEEWKVGVLACAGQMLASFASGEWPLFRASCTRQWGRACSWYEHCCLPAQSREKFLAQCGDVRPRAAGPTEQKQPLGLAVQTTKKKARQ